MGPGRRTSWCIVCSVCHGVCAMVAGAGDLHRCGRVESAEGLGASHSPWWRSAPIAFGTHLPSPADVTNLLECSLAACQSGPLGVRSAPTRAGHGHARLAVAKRCMILLVGRRDSCRPPLALDCSWIFSSSELADAVRHRVVTASLHSMVLLYGPQGARRSAAEIYYSSTKYSSLHCFAEGGVEGSNHLCDATYALHLRPRHLGRHLCK